MLCLSSDVSAGPLVHYHGNGAVHVIPGVVVLARLSRHTFLSNQITAIFLPNWERAKQTAVTKERVIEGSEWRSLRARAADDAIALIIV